MSYSIEWLFLCPFYLLLGFLICHKIPEMASNRQVSLTIRINGKEVRNTLQGVGAEIGRLRSDLWKINELDPNFKTKTEELKKARQRYAEINREINGLPKLMKAASDSFEAQKHKVEQLRKELDHMSRSSVEYKNKIREYRQEQKKLDDLNTEMTGKPTIWERMAKGVNLFTAVGGLLSLRMMQQGARQLISLSAELADKQADVRKTTGMTKEEVRALTQELDKLDTRTSRADLLSIAEEGGRIGIAKEEIADFTEAMNKANVALGDVFGSAEAVASTLGKLRFLYKETAEMGVSEAYNAIGSALNELGANGVANEQNIAAFATRVGALPDAFKPAIADAMALGAAFEESGVNAEVAGRSYSILIQTAANNTKVFAEVMGTTQEQVTQLLNSNPTEFFLQFAESLKGMDSNGVQMANTLKKLGISATGVNMIIGAASSNTDRFRDSIALANTAMEEGTSLTDEYNVKNENLAATLDKIQKTFVEWIDSDTVQDFVEGLVEWFGALIGAIDRTDEELNGWQRTLNFVTKAIGSLIVVMISYKTISWVLANATKENIKQTLLYQGVIKGKTATMNFAKNSMISYGIIAKGLTGRFITLRAVTILFGQALKSIPFVAIASAVIGLISYFTIFSKKTKEAADAQKEFEESVREAHKSAAEETGKSVAAVKSLINVIKDETATLENRKKAYQELIKIAPEFNGLLQDEIFNIKELTRVYEEYVTQLTKVAQAKATKQIHEDAQSEAVKGRAELFQVERELADAKAKLSGITQYEETQKLHDGVWETVIEETRAYKEQSAAIAELEKEKEKLLDRQKDLDERAESSTDFLDAERQRIQAQIDFQQKIIDSYEKEGEAFEAFVTEARKQLKYLNAEMAALGMPGLNDGSDSTTTPTPITDPKKEDPEIERRRRIAAELTKIERDRIRQQRDLELANREERAKLMEEGFAKEAELLDIERQKKINRLNDEQEDLLALQQEYNRRANEEAEKGNKSGASSFKKQADELNEIIKEKSETAYFIQKTYENNLQTLKLDSLKKQFDEEQKAYERRLRNLETEHNNELKSVVDLESAKQVLRDEYGYSEEELNKLKDFEKAKSKITLEQDKETYEIQSEQLQSQIDQLQGALSADDAMAGTIWGRMFDEEQREQIIEWIERLQNELSKIGKPDDDQADIDAENKKLGSFIDIFGFTADEWEKAFDKLDTMSKKLALVQMGVQAMTNAWNQFYSIQRANMQRDLDAFTSATNRKKESLAKQLEEGYISQEVYNAKVAKLDAELGKKKAEMEYKSAMAEWSMSLMQAATNTAVAVTAALKVPPAPNVVLASIAGGLGAIQTGLIAGNKPKKPEGYFDGGLTGGSGIYDSFGRELSDGPLHANEYVIPEWLRRDPQIARMEEFIEARRRGSNPIDSPISSSGGEIRPNITTPVNQQDSDDTNVALTLVMRELVETLRDFPTKPIEAKLSRTMEVAKYISDDLESYNNHRIKNKR